MGRGQNGSRAPATGKVTGGDIEKRRKGMDLGSMRGDRRS